MLRDQYLQQVEVVQYSGDLIHICLLPVKPLHQRVAQVGKGETQGRESVT